MLKGRILIVAICISPVMLILLSGQGCPDIVLPPIDPGTGQSTPPPSNCDSNRPPTAHAGPDIEVILGNRAFLNGRGSSDVDGDTLSYHWQSTRGPISIVLDSADSMECSFIPSVYGVYELSLTVSDTCGLSDEDTVRVSVPNPDCQSYPIARARSDRLSIC